MATTWARNLHLAWFGAAFQDALGALLIATLPSFIPLPGSIGHVSKLFVRQTALARCAPAMFRCALHVVCVGELPNRGRKRLLYWLLHCFPPGRYGLRPSPAALERGLDPY
jgi:hypothetical protein